MRSLLLLLPSLVAACGSSEPAEVEPPIDANLIDAPPAPVTVTARSHAVPAPGVLVAFLDDDDAVIANVTTDADGVASAIVPPGGKVAALAPGRTEARLWLGVQPGDELAVDIGSTAPVVTVTVIAPTRAGTSNYHVETACGSFGSSGTPTVIVSINPPCTTDLVIYRNVTGQLVDALVVTGQTLTGGQTLDLSAATYAPTILRTAAVTGVPDGMNSVFLEGSLTLATDPQLSRFGGDPALANGAGSVTGRLPDVADPAQVTLFTARGTGSIRHTVMRRARQDDASPLAVGALLPDVGAPLYDANARRASWAQGATGAAVDGVFAQLTFDGVTWFVASPAATAITLPALPAEFAAVDPGGAVFQRGQIRLFALTGGYAAARAAMFAIQNQRQLLTGDGQLAIADSGSPAS
jgi:hypothetical protein